MKKLLLVHWDLEEAGIIAESLEKKGWHVDIETEDGGRAVSRAEEIVPAAVIIYLNRLPSHGIKTGRSLHLNTNTSHLPLIFVNGDEQNRENILSLIPDAITADDSSLIDVLVEVLVQY